MQFNWEIRFKKAFLQRIQNQKEVNKKVMNLFDQCNNLFQGTLSQVVLKKSLPDGQFVFSSSSIMYGDS